MKRLTISVEDDQYAEIEHEADERGVSKSQVVRERLRTGEDAVKTGEDVVNSVVKSGEGAVNSGEDIVKLRDRLDDLEERVDELEGERPPTAQNAERSAQSDFSPETMDTLHQSEENAGSEGGPTPESTHVDDDLEGAWEEWIEEEGPNTLHGKEMMRDLLDRLRREQIVATGELREAWFEEWGDAYKESKKPKKSLWDSMKRHVEGAPGVEHPGTGQWRYAGDDELREELAEYVASES